MISFSLCDILMLGIEKAAQRRRTPKRVREFYAHNALALWGVAALRRFSIRATEKGDNHNPSAAFAARLSR
jgi:hypothetical protein